MDWSRLDSILARGKWADRFAWRLLPLVAIGSMVLCLAGCASGSGSSATKSGGQSGI